MARILDGKEIARKIRSIVEGEISALQDRTPKLSIILATEDESAVTYANVIKKAAGNSGINAEIIDFDEEVSQQALKDKLTELAENPEVNGIIIQSPIAKNVDIDELRSLIPLEKDIDGANPLSAGRLFSNLESFAPATAQAIIETLKYYIVPTSGKHAVVIGRSRIVGKPAAHMLLDMDCTVTICHSATKDLSFYTKSADILVVAAGKAGLIGKEHLDPKKKTTVIDVGTNFNEKGEMSGDVIFDEVEPISEAITPVPGGIGPITTAILLKNTLEAYIKQNKAKTP